MEGLVCEHKLDDFMGVPVKDLILLIHPLGDICLWPGSVVLDSEQVPWDVPLCDRVNGGIEVGAIVEWSFTAFPSSSGFQDRQQVINV